MVVQVSEVLAQRDLRNALNDGMWRRIIRWLIRKNENLLSFNEVIDAFQCKGSHYAGVQTVAIDNIIGSIGRCRHFDREFYPRRLDDPERWIRIARAHYQGIDLPPVELYKIGTGYFRGRWESPYLSSPCSGDAVRRRPRHRIRYCLTFSGIWI